MNDIVFKNVAVIDGTGNDAYIGDVATANGKITAVGNIAGDAAETVNGEGLTLAPGFIDAHGHADLFTGYDTLLANKLEQGITSEICGQCGLGPAPVDPAKFPYYEAYYKKLGAPVHPHASSFTSFKAYLDEMDNTPTGINLAYFVPHGTLRIAAIGLAPDKPTAEQTEHMKTLLDEAMEAGALGLSSGLMYAPGSYADRDELVELASVVGRHGGIYTSHIRNQAEGLLDGVKETIDVARAAGARANISHHKASGMRNWGRVKESSALIHNADIPTTHDVYPYTAASTTIWGTVPPRFQRMGQDGFLAFLSNKANFDELKRAIFEPDEEFDNAIGSGGFSSILILNAPKTPAAEGKTIEAYAIARNIEPFDAYIELMLQNELGVTYAGFEMAEEDVRTLLSDPSCMFGTDGLYMAGMSMTHPRAIGSFPRILGRYVRDEKLISLPEAIRKMTGYPADVYGFKTKGRIAVGMDADLVLFDANRITDHADYTNPLAPNEGIARVYVNGALSVLNGKSTGVKNGKTLRANN